MNLFQPLPGIERVSPVKACGLDRRINLRAFRSPLGILRASSRRVVVITSGTNSFHRCGGPPPSKREGLGVSPVKACGLDVDWI